MGIPKLKRSGFTIVELAVIITVIGILAAITLVSYGAWQKRTLENVVKTDLTSAAAALENARNFGSGYPLAVPSFTPSDNVILAGGAATISGSQGYCVQAAGAKDPTVAMYVTHLEKTPQNGNCAAWSSLVGWWPMNGNANDASGNSKNGTVSVATLATGRNGSVNGAYSFNGSSAYIATPTTSIPTAVTASAWVYSANFAQNGFVVGKNPVNAQWEIFFETSVMKWRGGAPYTDVTCSLPSNGAWHHIVGTQNGTAIALYKDGVLCGSGTATAIGNGTGTIDIGRFSSGYYFNGLIDDVRVYNQALTASDVAALYKGGAQ